MTGTCWPKAGPPPDVAKRLGVREIWEWLHDLADRVRPGVRRAFLAAVASLPLPGVQAVRQALAARDLGALLALLGPLQGVLAAALRAGDFVDMLEDTYVKAARDSIPRLARSLRQFGTTFDIRFDMVNPRSVEFLRAYQGNLIRELTTETVTGIMGVVREGFESGNSTFVMEKQILSVPGYGLTARQRKAVERYHGTLVEGGVPTDKALAQRAAYERKLLGFRAETIARTETIRAAERGREEGWRQAAEGGLFSPETTLREWIVTPDDRLCPYCRSIKKINAEGVPFKNEFRAPGGVLLRGPPAHPRCRCSVRLIFSEY